MAIIGIVAVDRAGAIGKGGTLPWHYPADLKFFKQQTTGNACVMGYRTWLSLKKPLPNRLNIVLTRQLTRRNDVELPESVLWLHDEQSVLSLNNYLNCDLYVLGGAQIFSLFRPHIDRWLVTQIPLTIPDADTFLPPDLLQDFHPHDTRDLGDDLKVTFYERAR